MPPLTMAAVGFVLGLRHALDPDHVVAVTTIASEKAGLRQTSLVGTFWGVGHAVSLTAVGGAVLALKLAVPPAVAHSLEALVALMLVGLGAAAVRTGARYRLHAHTHVHGERAHLHFHAHRPADVQAHGHRHPLAGGLKPFVVGLVHGLAGSAGLALLTLGTAPSLAAGIGYIALMALGSVLGMFALSALMGVPLTLLEKRYASLHLRIQFAAGLSSVLFGLWLFARHVAAASLAATP